MSQVYINPLDIISQGIIALQGDAGSTITAPTIKISTNLNGSTLFTGNSPSTIALNFVNGGNLVINNISGWSASGTFNTGIGLNTFRVLTTGAGNAAFGYHSLQGLTTGTENVAIGQALENITSGSWNIALGITSGSSYTSSESNNIVIGHSGILGESNVIRIGMQGSGTQQQNTTYIAGIYGSTPSGTPQTVIIDSNGQLGSSSSPITFPWTVVTGTSQTIAINNGYIANNAGTVSFALPATAAVGSIIRITGINNATGWTITQATGQQIFFGTASTTLGAGGSLSSSATRDSVELVCVVANTTYNVISSIGNITIV